MATKPSDIPNLEKQIKDLQGKSSEYQNKLNSSSTALGGQGEPTSTDIYNQESLQRINSEIQSLNDKRLKTKWYGTDKTENSASEGGSAGIIGTTLDFLTRPLYGVVGAVKHFTGKGEGTLQQDVADNMLRNKNTFGDVLKSSNVPWAVSAPLGFALDVAMDPVNWATMGTGALVPKLVSGAYKGVKTGEGVAKGLSIAAKSSVLEDASTIGRFIPKLNKTKGFEKLTESSINATKDWENLSGTAVSDLVQKKGINIGPYSFGLKDVVNKVADSIPGGQKFLQNFIYDPSEWVRQARIKDIFQDSLGGPEIDLRGAVNAYNKGESIEPFLKKVEPVVEKFPISTKGRVDIDMGESVNLASKGEQDLAVAEISRLGLKDKIEQESASLVNDVDDTFTILKNPKASVTGDVEENSRRLMEEALINTNRKIGGGSSVTLEEISKIVNSNVLGETGVKWYDNMINGVRKYTKDIDNNDKKILVDGKKTMDLYDKGIAIFKVAKVAASPSSWMNAILGNLIMTHMAGGSLSPRYLKWLKETHDLYGNKPGKAALFDGLMMDAGRKTGDSIRKGLFENRTASRSSFGNVLDFVGNTSTGKRGASQYSTEERLLMNARDMGAVSSSVKAKDIASETQESIAELKMQYDLVLSRVTSKFEQGKSELLNPVKSNLSNTKEVIRKFGKTAESQVSSFDIGSGMMSQELFNSGAVSEMFDYISEMAKKNPSNMGWKLLDITFNKMPEGYEKIDQTFKMATFMHATVDGYSKKEIMRLKNIVDISPEEIKIGEHILDGEMHYRLSAETAINLANIMYLNYAAMPSAVRVLRNMPILGSPFVSFMYGMALKTGQTLAYNPSSFNKVSFAMNDFGGTKTPLEKKALDTQFYSYLDKPGMFRIPSMNSFFEENPVYLNLSNAIPYYSLNMFNPSQTKYGDSTREKLVQAVQSSPIMKDPIGSNLFDFLIQPMILGDSIRPQGQFGQPIYPVDATGLEKAGYGARSFSEAFVPNMYSYAGLVTPEAVADYVPSYRWRQLSRATVGKNQLGISSKEDKASRTLRTVLQASGIPVQAPVNTSFTQGSK